MSKSGEGRTFIVTGGAGFIGSALVRRLLNSTPHRVVTVDALTYAGDLRRLESVSAHERHRFERLDITNQEALLALFEEERPAGVYHLAAESHVDRSIDGPEEFLRSNTLGTLRVLEATRLYLAELSPLKRREFRLINVSTDEVYGSLPRGGAPDGEERFTETTPFAPRSPYSASKAAADHFASAYFTTYALPVITTHASNNYGPFQYPEKLMPLVLARALRGESVPLYGDGGNVRDWLHVDDHARGLMRVAARGAPGATYLMGGDTERTNLEVVNELLGLLNQLAPAERDYRDLITFVADRPGHDERYAVDSSRAESELGFRRSVPFREGLEMTVRWYLENRQWLESVRGGYDLGRLGAPGGEAGGSAPGGAE